MKRTNKGRAFIAWGLAAALGLGQVALLPQTALADVRKADVVYGQTVDARGLSVSQCPSIDAERAFVMGADGTVYFERNANDPAQIASITKIMTAVVALDAVDAGLASLDDTVTVSAEAAAVGESSAGLKEGDSMSLKTAITAMLVPSGNDAAVAISQAVGAKLRGAGGASGDTDEDAFVSRMNSTASDLGCTDTVYNNPHGLDFDQYAGDLHSTASDQAKVVQHAMRNDLFRSVVSGGSTSIQVTRAGQPTSISLQTTDGFLEISKDAIGVKTGFTDLAGESFAGATNRNGNELYAIVLDSSSEGQRFLDADTLCSWVYDHNVAYKLVNTSNTTTMSGTQVPLVADVALSAWTDKTVKATAADPNATANIFDLNGNVSQSVEYEKIDGTVHAGDKVGTITYKQRNETVATVDLIAAETVAGPNPIEAIGVWFSRLFGGFSGQQPEADSVLYNQTPLVVDKTSQAA